MSGLVSGWFLLMCAAGAFLPDGLAILIFRFTQPHPRLITQPLFRSAERFSLWHLTDILVNPSKATRQSFTEVESH